jgi:hypothetical protein
MKNKDFILFLVFIITYFIVMFLDIDFTDSDFFLVNMISNKIFQLIIVWFCIFIFGKKLIDEMEKES